MPWNFILDELPTALVGAVVGLLLPWLLKLIRYAVASRKKHRLQGEWHSYHFSREGSAPVFRHEVWTVAKSLDNKMSVRTNDPERPNLRYIGTLREDDRGYVIVVLRGLNHPEEVHVRLYDLIPGLTERMYGFQVGIDFDAGPIATAKLVSRTEIPPEEVRQLLAKRAEYCRDEFLLRLKGA